MIRHVRLASVWLGLIMLTWPAVAGAQCAPAGRKAFVAGLEALNRGDLSAAARVLYRLVDEQPGCVEARNNLAVVFVEQGRLQEAAEQLRQALQTNPDYHRARLNLERVEGLIKGRREAAVPVTPPVEAPVPVPTLEMAQVETGVAPSSEVTAEPSKAPEASKPPETKPLNAPPGDAKAADAQLVGPPLPPGSPAAEARATAACVIEPGQNRLCVYQRTAGAMASDECYPIALVQVRSWPRWVVASEVSSKRIRLLDETGQTRLEILPEDAAVSGDALRLRQSDLDALATKVVPWRTGWLILE